MKHFWGPLCDACLKHVGVEVAPTEGDQENRDGGDGPIGNPCTQIVDEPPKTDSDSPQTDYDPPKAVASASDPPKAAASASDPPEKRQRTVLFTDEVDPKLVINTGG